MTPFPHDIFIAPSDVDPDTLANLGLLARTLGDGRLTRVST